MPLESDSREVTIPFFNFKNSGKTGHLAFFSFLLHFLAARPIRLNSEVCEI